MYKNKILFFFQLIVLSGLMIIVGCTSEKIPVSTNTIDKTESGESADKNTPQKGGEVVIAYQANPSNLDPVKGNSGYDQALLWPLYDTLINFTAELEPEAGLAESWDILDEKTIELTLREGAKFHDGTPVDAEAVKFNIERTNSEESQVSQLKNVESVEVVDFLTVKLHLKQPDSSVLLALSERGGMMVSPAAVEKSGEDYSQSPVGAGPYKMVKHVPNSEMIFEAYEDYWQEGQPYLDKMTIKIMADENARINALKSGEVDLASSISATNIESLENSSGILIKDTVVLSYSKLFLNPLVPPFDNKAVRLAVQHGINREEIVQAVFFGRGEPAYQSFPKDYWAHNKDLTIEYDPEKSRKILKDAGLENVSFNLLTFPYVGGSRFPEVIKGQLEQVGIEVNIVNMELNAAVSKYFSEKTEPSLLAGTTGNPDPQMTINNAFSSDSYYLVGGGTPKLDLPISKAEASYDKEERIQLYGEINTIAQLEEVTEIPLYFNSDTYAMKEQVKGFEPNLLGKPIFSEIWIEK